MKKLLALALISFSLLADPTLKSALNLTMDQARVVEGIQAAYRPKFAKKRSEYHTEMRKLRRANIANDSKLVAELTKTTDKLRDELRAIRESEVAEIRTHLTPEQKQKYAEFREWQKTMVGPSRDDFMLYTDKSPN
jgi:Spy/CpxP family protein refolding chaperone